MSTCLISFWQLNMFKTSRQELAETQTVAIFCSFSCRILARDQFLPDNLYSVPRDEWISLMESSHTAILDM
jgi:hypothetical protein